MGVVNEVWGQSSSHLIEDYQQPYRVLFNETISILMITIGLHANFDDFSLPPNRLFSFIAPLVIYFMGKTPWLNGKRVDAL